MNYTLHQLQVYLMVVKIKSVTKAAEALNMTQPALSIQLKNFQQQFEYPLTEVIGRKLFVTDFGYKIAEIAERVINESEELKYQTKAYGGIVSGKLRISSVSTGKYVIPYFLKGFLDENESVELELDVTNKSLVVESLKNNEIDFALVSVKPENLDLEEEGLLDNRLYMVSNTPEFDGKRPYIFRENGSATRAAMDEYLKSEKVEVTKRMELTSNEAVKQALIAGLGYSILPLIGIRNELKNKELFIVNQNNLPISTEWRLTWLKQKRFSKVAEAYLDYIRKNKTNLIDENFRWHQELL